MWILWNGLYLWKTCQISLIKFLLIIFKNAIIFWVWTDLFGIYWYIIMFNNIFFYNHFSSSYQREIGICASHSSKTSGFVWIGTGFRSEPKWCASRPMCTTCSEIAWTPDCRSENCINGLNSWDIQTHWTLPEKHAL